jgi:polyhydroxybutyrate depolymerase
VPTGYDPSKPTPVVLLLHGFGANGIEQDLLPGFHFGDLANARTFLFLNPDGTLNTAGQRYWDATDACCAQYGGHPVDDVGYLGAVLDDVERKFNVDKKRVFVVGHSNGGFMAHRLACDLAPRIAAIVSLAGVTWLDPTRCKPSEPVAVLQVHGTADLIVHYDGGHIGDSIYLPEYPAAPVTVQDWGGYNGCAPGLMMTETTLDIETVLPGAETTVQRFTGCPSSGAVELWSIQGGSHVPSLVSTWSSMVYDFMMAHAKP